MDSLKVLVAVEKHMVVSFVTCSRTMPSVTCSTALVKIFLSSFVVSKRAVCHGALAVALRNHECEFIGEMFILFIPDEQDGHFSAGPRMKKYAKLQ